MANEPIGKAVLELSTRDRGLVRGLRQAEDAVGKFHRTSVSAINRVRTAVFNLQGAFSAFVAGLAVKEIIETADALTLVEGRLSLVTDSAENLAEVQDRLYQISNDTRVSFLASADLYARLGRATEELGTSQEDLLAVTETINKALIVSGASAAEAEAALIQLSQGLASGAIMGEELRSVLEQTPRLAQAIAAGLGVTVGELRKLGSEGELTAERVLEALLSQADVIDAEFSRMRITVGQALTVLNNELGRLINSTDEGTSATALLAQGILSIADAVRALTATGILEAVVEGFKELWDLLTFVPHEVIEYFNEVQNQLDETRTKLSEVKAEAQDQTSWNQFVSFLTEWGQNTIRVFSFTGKSALNIFLAAVGDMIASVKALGRAVVALGALLWDALTLDTEGVKQRWGELVGVASSYNAEIRANWAAMTSGILGDFDRMRTEMIGGAQEQAEQVRGVAESTADSMIQKGREVTAAVKGQVKEQVDAFKELIDQLRFEIDLLGKSETEQRAMTLARQAGVAVGSKQYQQILNLVQAHEQERTALDAKADLIERGKQLTEEVRTEEEIRADRLAELNTLLRDGAIDQETYNRALKDIEKSGREVDNTMARLGATFESAFENAIVAGAALSDVLKGLAQDVARVVARMTIIDPLAGALTGAIGSFFGAGIMHEGGVVGYDTGGFRFVPSSVFAHAPRLHSGLRPDEFPAILQYGETVLPRGVSPGNAEVNMYITQNIDARGPGNQGGPEELAAAAKKISERTQQDIIESYRSGGLWARILGGRR